MEQILRAERGGREHDLIGAPGLTLFANPPSSVDGFNLVPAGRRFTDVDDGCHRVNLRARLFREVQVVSFEDVLGIVRTPVYAARAEDAAGAIWPKRGCHRVFRIGTLSGG
jgi:hypothetical protein